MHVSIWIENTGSEVLTDGLRRIAIWTVIGFDDTRSAIVKSRKRRDINMKIWVVLPAYNEEQALPDLIHGLDESLSEEGRQFQVIVVNDGSSDRTLEVARSFEKTHPVQVVDNGVNKGLAETLRRGLIHALNQADDRDVIVTMDADNTHPAGLALRMIRSIREGNDVVIASRYRPGSYVRGLSLFRRFLSFGAAILFRITFPTRGVRDYTCGYRAYRTSVLKQLQSQLGDRFISEKGFACMVDLLLQLRRLNLIFTEVPLVLRYDLKPGRSKMQISRTIKETLLLLLRRRLLPSSYFAKKTLLESKN